MVSKKKSKLIEEEIDEFVIKSRVQIKDPLIKFYRRITSGTKNFVGYQIPAARDNLKTWATSFRGGIIILCMAIVILLPLILNDATYYHLFTVALIYSIFAASWDLLAGVTGQVSFGHSAFFGIGGYVFTFSTTYFQAVYSWSSTENWPVALLIAAISTVIIGLIIAIPALRLKGPYLALGTLAFSLLLFYLVQFPELQAESIDLPIELRIWRLSDPVREFLIILIIMIVSIVILLAIYNSKLGTIFKGIRDDEHATEASGINITKYKLIAFIISSFFAGLAGSLYTLHLGNVNFELFSNRLSFFPVIFTLLGGIATISGAVLGAFTFVLLTRVISEIITFSFPNLPAGLTTQIETISVFIFAVILIIIIRFTDRGIMEPMIRHTKSFWDIILGK